MFQSLPIANAPVGADWTDQRDPVTVVVDRSRRVVLRTSEEVALVRRRVFHDILEVDGIQQKPALSDLVHLFFGEDGPIFAAFQSIPGFQAYNTFRVFMGIVFLTSRFGMSYARMKNSVCINPEMLNGMKMSDEEYLNLWKEIEAHGLPNGKG